MFTDSVPGGDRKWNMSGNTLWPVAYEQYGPLRLQASVFNNQSTTNISSEQLRDATVEELRRFGPLIGHYILRQDSEAVIEGTKLATTTRLFVNDKICLSMSAFFLAIAILSGYASVRHRQDVRLWTRDPATTFGLLVYLNLHPEKTCPSADTGSQSHKKLW